MDQADLLDPIEPGFRIQALFAVEGFLRLLREAVDRYGDLESFAVYLAVLAANAGNVSRDPELAARFGGSRPIPREYLRPVSRRAVALSTGLSRETARRKLAQLVADGHLIDEAGGLRAPETVLAQRGNLDYARLLVSEFLRTSERIRRVNPDEA